MTEFHVQRVYKVRINGYDLQRIEGWSNVIPVNKLIDACTRQVDQGQLRGILYLVRNKSNRKGELTHWWTTIEEVSLRDLMILESVEYIAEEAGVAFE